MRKIFNLFSVNAVNTVLQLALVRVAMVGKPHLLRYSSADISQPPLSVSNSYMYTCRYV